MHLEIPNWLTFSFLLIVLLTLVVFYHIHQKNKKVLLFLLVWVTLQSVLAANHFYVVTEDVIFNRFIFVLIPGFIVLFYAVFSKKGKKFYSSRNVYNSPIIHTLRIPVEITLYYLAQLTFIPVEMTFEGRNFDILVGISAPFIVFLFHKYKQMFSDGILLFWNIIGLFLVLFILINGVLASPFTYQYFSFSQPNIAVSYFPFILLPALIVPIVIFIHISDIRILINNLKNEKHIYERNN